MYFVAEHRPFSVLGEAPRWSTSEERQDFHVPTPSRSFILSQEANPPQGRQAAKPTHQRDGRA